MGIYKNPEKQNPKFVFTLIQFLDIKLGECPRIHLATPKETAQLLNLKLQEMRKKNQDFSPFLDIKLGECPRNYLATPKETAQLLNLKLQEMRKKNRDLQKLSEVCQSNGVIFIVDTEFLVDVAELIIDRFFGIMELVSVNGSKDKMVSI